MTSECSAQWLGIGEWGGTYESGFEYSRENSETRGSSRSRLQDILSENRLSLRNRGIYLVDPRILNLSVGGTIGFSQNWIQGNGGNESRHQILLGYDVAGSLLPLRNLSLSFYANRNESQFSGGRAGRIENLIENRGATLSIRHLYIPSTISFRQEFRDSHSQTGLTQSRNRHERNVLHYEGQRGWIDSELDVLYEFVDFKDEIFPNLSYDGHEGSLYYSVDFGTELNWRLDSRLRYRNRSGATSQETFNWHESLRIDHTDRLRTHYDYNLNRIETAGGASLNHQGSFRLFHRLYESLATNFGLRASFQNLPDGRQNDYHGDLGFNYTKRLPRDGLLNIGLGTGLGYSSSRFRGTESFVPQEPHVAATPFALAIPLNNPFVVLESVVITKTSFGPLPTGCVAPPGPPTPLVLGRDYELQTIGDITEIQPLPCAGAVPGINPGDGIAVDYRFGVAPSLSYTTMNWYTNVSVDYGWIRPFYSHEQTNHWLLSGSDERFLDDRRSDTIGSEFRYDRGNLSARAVAEFQHFSSERSLYDRFRTSQFARYRASPNLTLTLSADQSLFNFSRPNRETKTSTIRGTVNYRWNHALSVSGFLGSRSFDDSRAPSEHTWEAGAQARWSYRRVEILPSVEFIRRSRGDTETNEFRFGWRIIRRF